MHLKEKCILIISPEPWNHIFVSKHHYAIHLAKRNNKVFFLNPPSMSFGISKTEYKDLSQIDYTGFISGLRFFPKVIQQMIMLRKWRRLEKLAGLKFDVIWSFDNSVFYDFSFLDDSILKISHIVDLNQNFQRCKAAATAHYCFCSSDFILSELKRWNAKTFKINHGFNQLENTPGEVILPGKNKIKAFYCGNLDISYLDWELATKLAEDNLNVDFLYAGTMTFVKSIFELKNVFYLGILSSSNVQAYMGTCDINLILYKADQYKEQLANPHKMMEYMGSGKVILSTFSSEYESCNDLIVMVKHNSEIQTSFKDVISNLKSYNALEKIQKRKEFASRNSYDNQIDKIQKFLSIG